jgi:hypothetical protein
MEMRGELDFPKDLAKYGKVSATVLEKVDGANISLVLNIKDGKIANIGVCKRGGAITCDKELFTGCMAAIVKYTTQLQDFSKSFDDAVVVIYGELYGKHVIKRIDYKIPDKTAGIVFYAMTIDGVWQSFATVEKLPLVPIVMRNVTMTDVNTELIEKKTLDSMTSLLAARNAGVASSFAEGCVVLLEWHNSDGKYTSIRFKLRRSEFLEKVVKKSSAATTVSEKKTTAAVVAPSVAAQLLYIIAHSHISAKLVRADSLPHQDRAMRFCKT